MSPIQGCGFKCQRDTNINKLKDLYLAELDKYDTKYQDYLQAEFDTSKRAGQNQIKANQMIIL